MGRRSPTAASEPPPQPAAFPIDELEAQRARDEGASAAPIARQYEVVFDRSFIDPDVQKVVRRLTRHGHEAYLVGGCVRDLLLERRPKDFDVATSAHPEQVRALFRNSRIIGRRFRLVHVLFHGGKVFEVATFRRDPGVERNDVDEEESLLIRNDNVFGQAHEDALRRDFTMNGLFYDVEANRILDWVGGLDDIKSRVVRTIGDPEKRFREDPVRVLRAIKFAGRLDLGIAPEVYDAIVSCRSALRLAARPRVAEEILRLMRGGQARRSIYIAWETGVLDVLLPELAALLYDSEGDNTPGARVWRQLSYVDSRHRQGTPPDDTVLWTLLLLETLKEACEGQRDRSAAASRLLERLVERLAIPRRSADGMRRITVALPRVLAGKANRLARSDLYPLMLEVAEADRRSTGQPRPSPTTKRRHARTHSAGS